MSKIKMPKGLVSVRATSWFLDIGGFLCPRQKWWPLGFWAPCKDTNLIMKLPLSWPIYLPNTGNLFFRHRDFEDVPIFKSQQSKSPLKIRSPWLREGQQTAQRTQEVEMDQGSGRKSFWPHTRISPLFVLYGAPKGMGRRGHEQLLGSIRDHTICSSISVFSQMERSF